MNKAKWLLATGLVALTAGCVQETTTYAPRGAAYYPAPQATYYATPQVQVQTQAQAQSRYWNSPRADADRDGIPNRYDRDANGDRIPDRYQGR